MSVCDAAGVENKKKKRGRMSVTRVNDGDTNKEEEMMQEQNGFPSGKGVQTGTHFSVILKGNMNAI